MSRVTVIDPMTGVEVEVESDSILAEKWQAKPAAKSQSKATAKADDSEK